jgi:hypothetical protein
MECLTTKDNFENILRILAIAAFGSVGFSTAAFASGGKSPACPERRTAGT